LFKLIKYFSALIALLFVFYYLVYFICAAHSSLSTSIANSEQYKIEWSATGNHVLEISVRAAGPAPTLTLVSVYRRGPFDYVYGEATFDNLHGMIDTLWHAPSSGHYEGVFGDGLFWSMRDYTFSPKLAWKYASLPKWKRHVFILDAEGRVKAGSHVRLVAPREGLSVKNVKLGTESLRIVEGLDGQTPRKPVLLIGGSDNQDLKWQAYWLAEHGVTSALLSINPDLTTDCFHNADPEILNRKVEALRDYTKSTDIVVVGLSAGAVAALIAQAQEADPHRKTFAISPALFHFNGAKGPFCAQPAAAWKSHTVYRNFYGSGFVGAWNYLNVAAGTRHQRDAILEWLPTLDENELQALQLMERIPSNSRVYFGLEDNRLPQEFTSERLCSEEMEDCEFFPGAGHDLLFEGHVVIGCNYSGELASRACTATKQAELKIAADILSATMERH
jgi:pimeloyl-ACP methyl ester carboxylesterase